MYLYIINIVYILYNCIYSIYIYTISVSAIGCLKKLIPTVWNVPFDSAICFPSCPGGQLCLHLRLEENTGIHPWFQGKSSSKPKPSCSRSINKSSGVVQKFYPQSSLHKLQNSSRHHHLIDACRVEGAEEPIQIVLITQKSHWMTVESPCQNLEKIRNET